MKAVEGHVLHKTPKGKIRTADEGIVITQIPMLPAEVGAGWSWAGRDPEQMAISLFQGVSNLGAYSLGSSCTFKIFSSNVLWGYIVL